MAKRIKIHSFVSTEAWQFDRPGTEDTDRWSYSKFGASWRDSRLYGIVKGKAGEKWTVNWDIDDTTSNIESSKLVLENPCTRKSPGINTSQVTSSEVTNTVVTSEQSTDESDIGEIDESDFDSDYIPEISKKRQRMKIDSESEVEDGNTVERRVQSSISDGEEVYLCTRNGKKVFRATFAKSEEGETVHGQHIGLGQGRFFIVKVLKKCLDWTLFDSDVHVAGAAILWDTRDTSKFKSTPLSNLGTEARQPSMLQQRKKKQNPSNWAKNIAKDQLQRGLRKYGHSCDEKAPLMNLKASCNQCRMKCNDSFTEEARLSINKNFWQLANTDLQRAFIVSSVAQKGIKRQRKRKETKTGKRRQRENARSYSLIHPETKERLNVCQIFFINTLNINKKRITTALSKVSETGTLLSDTRGREGSHNAVSTEREQPVIEHIQQFRTVESHYVRKNSSWQYLPEELTIREMHRMYKLWCTERGEDHENYEFYTRTFKTRFNLKMHKPKKDVCDICSGFENTPVDNRTNEQIERQTLHREEKERARLYKSSVKAVGEQSDKVVVAAFDFQKTLLCPYGQVSSFYYSQRLRNYNFTITDINSMETACFLWNETQAKKGSCEVATCLFKYLSRLDKKTETVHLFCDRCAGQNNNRTVVVMLLYASMVLDMKEICINYLVTGHSQNENDTAHSVIESATKHKSIFSTDQWHSAISWSFKKREPVVEILDFTNVYDFKSGMGQGLHGFNSIWKSNVKITKGEKAGEKLYWTKIMQLKVSKDNPGLIYFKYSYNDKEFQQVQIANPKVTTRNSEVQRSALPQLYMKEPGISKDKQKDLLKLCEKNLIPSMHHHFYRSLPLTEDSADEEE